MRRAKLVLIVGLSLALMMVIVQNTSPVLGRFLWFSAEVPAILLLVLTAVGGFVLGLLVAIYYQREKKLNPPQREYIERTFRS